jgi:hypothetical protein
MSFDDLLDGLIAFGRAVSSKQGRARSVLLTILGDRDASGHDERHTDRAAWGHASILHRPAAPSGNGDGEELVFLRRGDDAIVIASRDLRWQVSLEEGETVIRGLGANAARVRLKPNGDVLIEGGTADAAIAIPRDDLLQGELQKIQTTLGTGSNSGGAVVFATPYVIGSTQSQRVKVDR